MDAGNQGVSKEGHRFSLITYEARWEHVWECTVCRHRRVGDGDRLVALDRRGELIQSPEKNAELLKAECPGHPRVRRFIIKTDQDLDAFSVAMAETVIAANPSGWPIIKNEFLRLVQMSRLTLHIDEEPAAYYIVEADDRVLWEEDDLYDSQSHPIIMQMPREVPLRRSRVGTNA